MPEKNSAASETDQKESIKPSGDLTEMGKLLGKIDALNLQIHSLTEELEGERKQVKKYKGLIEEVYESQREEAELEIHSISSDIKTEGMSLESMKSFLKGYKMSKQDTSIETHSEEKKLKEKKKTEPVDAEIEVEEHGIEDEPDFRALIFGSGKKKGGAKK